MIDKSNEYSPKSNVSKPIEENEIEIPNFKLLYKGMPNSERDKSSGASSDEETTSSSLIPIPDSLKQLKSKLKRTVSDAEHSESAYNVSEILEKPAEVLRNSLEELRKKYSLKNESSVALKMNSANLILDDILNSTNLNLTSNDNLQSRFIKQQEVKSQILSENETSTVESSVSVTKHYPHIVDHPHPIAYDFFTPLCPKHGTFSESLHDSVEKGSFVPKPNIGIPQRKKTLMERIQDFPIKCKIQSVYRSFQRTRNPFAKARKEQEVVKLQQGIPGVDCHENHQSTCQCDNCPAKHQSKRLNLDLLESSELSQSDSKISEWEGRHCTCFSQRECDCPEVIPKCNCIAMSSQNTSKPHKHSPAHSDLPNINNDNVHETQSNKSASHKQEGESSSLLPKGNEDNKENKNKKTNSLLRHFRESKKFCSHERSVIERTDIYYFDHGNSAYYQTTDSHPIRYTECLVERTDHYATKFWAEFFGTIEIGVAFLISFFLQFYRFLFTSIIRSLTVGLLQISSDYFIKPFLTIIFNGLIQPCLILAYNIATSVRDLCLPISQIFGFFAKEVANILRSCRLVEVNREKQASCYCENKV